MRLLQERRGAHTSTYVYEPGSYVPLARIDGAGALEPHPAAAHALGADPEQGKRASVPITNPDWPDRFHVAKAAAAANDGLAKVAVGEQVSASPAAQVYYFHTQPSGLPEELSDNGGNLVWTAQYSTWGSTLRETWHRLDAAGSPQEHSHSNAQPLQQNLRLQGQYLDRETGLHYNTFRYYDADLGAFTTPDPIGLHGGLNLHQYAPNPIAWIDPWGWAKECNKTATPSKKGAIKEAGLPTKGRIRYVPPSNWKPGTPLPKGNQKGYVDKFGNEWTKGPSRTKGQPHEWDVQLSPQGRSKIGWTTRDGSHANVSLDGKITHK